MLKMRQLNIRLSLQEYTALRQLAYESRKKISELIRELIQKEEKQQKKKSLREACAFGQKFAKAKGIKEEQVIEAIMESRYGENWKQKLS